MPRTKVSAATPNAARLSELFGGRQRFAILRALYLNPARRFTNRALAQATSAEAGNVHRLLVRWSALGLVRREVEGRNIHYRASADPLLAGLRDLFLRSDALVEDLRAALPPTVDAAIIHGSAARGEEAAESDIDVLVVGQGLSSIKINAALKPVGRKHDRSIQATVFDRAEFARRVTARDAFALSVLSGPTIAIKGEISDRP